MVVHPKVTPGDTVYTVTYRSTDEAAILFQRWGSIWPKVRSVSVCLNALQSGMTTDKTGLPRTDAQRNATQRNGSDPN
jgi:hypothetical protein